MSRAYTRTDKPHAPRTGRGTLHAMTSTTAAHAIAALALALPIALALASPHETTAPCPPAAGFTLHTLTHPGPNGTPTDYRYAIYRPANLPPNTPAPGLLFLHGRGECGTDGTRHLAVGLGKELIWSNDRWPMVVVMPQKPTQDSEWEDHESAVLAMLDLATEAHTIDPGRIAITGLSQGGHGTLTLAARHPHRFAAAAPVCAYNAPRFTSGNFQPKPPATPDTPEVVAIAEALAEAGMPIWLFHGDEDTVIPHQESKALYEALAARGAEAELTLHVGVGHNAWDHAYPDPALAEWFRNHLDAETRTD